MIPARRNRLRLPPRKRDSSVNLTDFNGKLKALHPGIEADEVYPKAVRVGAELLADGIEQNTPIGLATAVLTIPGQETKGGPSHQPVPGVAFCVILNDRLQSAVPGIT